MTDPVALEVSPTDHDRLTSAEGVVAVIAAPDGTLSPAARHLDGVTGGAVGRAVASSAFEKADPGAAVRLAHPAGLAARSLRVLKLAADADAATARRAGGQVGAALVPDGAWIAAGDHGQASEIALGALLRAYEYRELKTDEAEMPGGLRLMADEPGAVDRTAVGARAAGAFLTRDLVNAPANVLTTQRFADELLALREHRVEVEILDEPALEEAGLRALLAVGLGSESASKLAVMRWRGEGAEDRPLALIGKGVVFDTGGISMKPAQGMEEMTMDMGGAAVVAGTMKTLAMRGARAHVVGVVGLVENMPDGRAQRPGDVVRSMKGDTIEVINTDAEGRLVLADAMWYVQDRLDPVAMIDLATLTGAMIVSLGLLKAGLFATDDDLADALLGAAAAEGEGMWRLPLDLAYAKGLKSRVADVRNVGSGREAGAIVAAEFLRRFVREDMPWAHLDIAGVTSGDDGPTHPKGATGWGVLTLDRLVADRYEV